MSVEIQHMRSHGDKDTSRSNSDNYRTFTNTAFDGQLHVDGQGGDEVPTYNGENDYNLEMDSATKDDVVIPSGCHRSLLACQNGVYEAYARSRKTIWTVAGVILLILYTVYLGLALDYRLGDEGSWRLLGFSIFGFLLLATVKIYRANETAIDAWWAGQANERDSKCIRIAQSIVKWFLRVGVFVALLAYVIVDIALDHPGNLISVAGLLLYILIFFVTSINPAKVNWHTVFWGMALQYTFALMILRTQWGYDIFKWLGDRVSEFLDYSNNGIVFVFGEKYTDHIFAMKALSIVVFFVSFINVMYYLGVMQAGIKVLGSFLAFCMQTTPAESISTAGNIFVGQAEAPLMIRPFLPDMTRSELHAVMTGGFASISGSVLGAYIAYGVPANHLLSASVMSAPAALAISKLSYPETEETKSSKDDFNKMGKAPEHNLFEAASNGASASIKIVGAIAANVLAFLSILAFVNATLTWFGDRVGVENLTLEFLCSYVLYPVAYFMGVDTDDCRKVAELVGIKTFTNEFIAYDHLRSLINNRHALNNYTTFYNTTEWFWDSDNIVLNITGQVLQGGVISEKSEVISTYALCGFANFSSIGIQLGALGVLAPSRKSELAQMVLRAMICGNAACFLTACIAGLFYKPFQ